MPCVANDAGTIAMMTTDDDDDDDDGGGDNYCETNANCLRAYMSQLKCLGHLENVKNEHAFSETVASSTRLCESVLRVRESKWIICPRRICTRALHGIT